MNGSIYPHANGNPELSTCLQNRGTRAVQPASSGADPTCPRKHSMKKTLLLSSILLLSAFVWARSGTQDATSQSGISHNRMMVEGCLSGSDGNYTLTDKSGKTYNLDGDMSKLAGHIGETFSLAGSTSPSTSSNSTASGHYATAGSPYDSYPTLTVTAVRLVGASCGAWQP